MENGVQENQVRESFPAGEIPADGVKIRVDPAELTTRPLSQFILSKEYVGVSANPELIRPVTLVAASGSAEERRREPVSAPARRIEYPFYDDDESDSSPVTVETCRTEPETVDRPESADAPEVLDLAADRPVSPPRPSAPVERDAAFQPIRLPHLLVSYSVVSPDEAASPLLPARGRNEEFPILNYFLNAAPLRR